MSVRVNLLPSEVRERGRANRARIGAVIAGVVLLVVLAGMTLLQRSSIGDAEDQLASIQAENEQLNAEIVALQPFADLEARANSVVEVVEVALSGERSLAAVLQDLSAVLPPNSQIDGLVVALSEEAQAPASGGDRVVYGTLSANGRVIDGVAPGVERLIIDLDRVAAFDNAYVTTSTVDEDGIVSFTLEVELGSETLTRRYVVTDAEVAS